MLLVSGWSRIVPQWGQKAGPVATALEAKNSVDMRTCLSSQLSWIVNRCVRIVTGARAQMLLVSDNGPVTIIVSKTSKGTTCRSFDRLFRKTTRSMQNHRAAERSNQSMNRCGQCVWQRSSRDKLDTNCPPAATRAGTPCGTCAENRTRKRRWLARGTSSRYRNVSAYLTWHPRDLHPYGHFHLTNDALECIFSHDNIGRNAFVVLATKVLHKAAARSKGSTTRQHLARQ